MQFSKMNIKNGIYGLEGTHFGCFVDLMKLIRVLRSDTMKRAQRFTLVQKLRYIHFRYVQCSAAYRMIELNTFLGKPLNACAAL